MARRRPKLLHIFLIAIVIACLLGIVIWRDVSFVRLERVQIHTDRMAVQFRVLQITDLHEYDRFDQIPVVQKYIRDNKPNMIAITGDAMNPGTTHDKLLRPWLKGLVETKVPVFYVDGNHDAWNTATSSVLHPLLIELGIKRLSQQTYAFDGQWGYVDLIGVGDYSTHSGNLKQVLSATRPGAYRLVLTHSPNIAEDLAQQEVDLAICGHTHGGQVRLPFVGAIYVPGQGFFPKYSKGSYDVGKAKLYVDSGIGTTGLPVRFFNPAQVTLLEIG